MIKAIKSDPSRYSVDDAHLVQIDKQLFNLKGALLDGRIFLVTFIYLLKTIFRVTCFYIFRVV